MEAIGPGLFSIPAFLVIKLKCEPFLIPIFSVDRNLKGVEGVWNLYSLIPWLLYIFAAHHIYSYKIALIKIISHIPQIFDFLLAEVSLSGITE